MSRTPISDNLVHKPKDVEENAKLFDAFVSLIDFIPEELRERIASNLLEKIRHKVDTNGEVQLPFGLVIKKNPESVS